jgi:hypothetical protein
MKEVIIKVPETKLNFFMELIAQLGFEVTQKYDIPEDHMSIVRDRMAKTEEDPNRPEDWDEAKKKLNLDS